MPAPTAVASPVLGRRHDDVDKQDDDLTSFRRLCHRLYYDKDPTSARKIDQILSRLPAQDRTAYARAMADVRSVYHRDHEIRRRAQVEHLLSEVEPASIVKGAIGISPRSNDPSTTAMRSRAARRIRVERFKAFLSTNCHAATVMPGPHPFLRGLFATLWLQTRIPHNGCVEWTVDVAVLTEAGSGESWTRDAVELLKGVLGMSERVQAPQVASTYADSTYTSRLSSAFSDLSSSPAASHPNEISTKQLPSQPILRSNTTRAPVVFERSASSLIAKQGGGPPPPVPPHRGSPLRTRAPSDPFLDNKALLPVASDQEEEVTGLGSRAAPLPPPSSSLLTKSGPLDPLGSDSDLASPTASTPFLPTPTSAAGAERPPDARLISSKSARPDDPAPIPPPAIAPHRPPPPPPRLPPNPAVPPQFRTFTLPPYLTNPELYALLRLFPSFIAAPVRRAVNNRSSSMSTTIDELEEKLSAVVHGEVALASGEAEGGGTTARRSDGWKGTLWERFLLWLRRLFGLM